MSPLFHSLIPVGAVAPDFRLLDQHGHSLGLADATGPNGLILLFFSSFWLPGDISLLESYIQAYPKLQEQGLGVMAISGINWEPIHQLAKRLNSPFPMAFDPCCRVAKRYGNIAIPKFLNGRAIFGVAPQGQVILARKQASPQEVLAGFSGYKPDYIPHP